MEMSENWFHFFFYLINFSLLVWGGVLLWNWSSPGIHSPSGPALWVLEWLSESLPPTRLEFDLVFERTDGNLTFRCTENVFWGRNGDKNSRCAWSLLNGMECWETVDGWKVGEIGDVPVGGVPATDFLLFCVVLCPWSWQWWGLKRGYHVTSYCPCPWLWRMTSIFAGCFRNCVELEVLGRAAAFLKGWQKPVHKARRATVPLWHWPTGWRFWKGNPHSYILFNWCQTPGCCLLLRNSSKKVGFCTVSHSFSINEN